MNSSYKKYLLFFLFCIGCVGTLSGAVNLGFSSFLMGIPFLIIIVTIAKKKKGLYFRTAIVVSILSVFLFFLKYQDLKFFYPVIGEKIYLSSTVCYNIFEGYGERTIIINKQGYCNYGITGMSKKGSGYLEKGSGFIVKGVYVHSPDFSETYSVVFETSSGDVLRSIKNDHSLFIKENGEYLKTSDLRNDFFYNLSMLMYWPIIPMIIFSKI